MKVYEKNGKLIVAKKKKWKKEKVQSI
jgi:hypothetical protein